MRGGAKGLAICWVPISVYTLHGQNIVSTSCCAIRECPLRDRPPSSHPFQRRGQARRDPHKLLRVVSILSSHSPSMPLTSAGFCHSAQWPASTSFRVRCGMKCSMPSDRLGGNARSLVARMNRTGTSIVFFSSLQPTSAHPHPQGVTRNSRPSRCGKAAYRSSSSKFCSRVLYQFTAIPPPRSATAKARAFSGCKTHGSPASHAVHTRPRRTPADPPPSTASGSASADARTEAPWCG